VANETSLDDVYRKFGEVSEAAQLLETELGNILLLYKGAEAGLFDGSDHEAADKILDHINRSTLGQLLWQLRGNHDGLDALEEVIAEAKSERNRLIHSFYRDHNFRRNSSEGCKLMLRDLESMHGKIIEAYKAVMKLSGLDLDKLKLQNLPTGHIPI
jgi:hypothetical protein